MYVQGRGQQTVLVKGLGYERQLVEVLEQADTAVLEHVAVLDSEFVLQGHESKRVVVGVDMVVFAAHLVELLRRQRLQELSVANEHIVRAEL